MANDETEMLKSDPPVLSATALPDSPIRTTNWYQIYNRLARPTLDWVAVMGAFWLLLGGYIWGHTPTDAQMLVGFSFIGGIYGTRTLEKIKNVY